MQTNFIVPLEVTISNSFVLNYFYEIYFTILFTFFVSSGLIAQSWNFEIGNNITRYVFTNSAGANPDFLKPSSGLHLALSRENKISNTFVYEIGMAYNQYNSVGDTQNIPFSYQADFIGLTGGIGPSYTGLNGLTISAKGSGAIQTLVNGTQFLQNHYVDLAGDSQFSGMKVSIGYTISIAKKVNDQMSVFTSFQHLDTNLFGKSTLSFVPTTFSFGLKIASK